MREVSLFDVSGSMRRVRLGKELASGGAGAVHEVGGERAIVVKLYNADTLRDHGQEYEKKIQHMLRHVPLLTAVPDPGIVQLSWPTAVARGPAGDFVGFAMPRLDFGRTEKLESLLQPKLAQLKKLRTDLGARITVAANLTGVVSAIHEKGHRIVDMKPVNLQFYRQELYVAVLDCDGFEIQVPGNAFSAPQVTPEYLAPEFQGKSVTDPERQDRFALAVIIFKLLNFGIHPYSGIAKERNAPTDLEGKIAKGLYAYSVTANPKIDPMSVSAHHCLPDEIREMFDRAFSANFYQRPSAREWLTTLHRYALTSNALLIPCKVGHLHFSGRICGECHRSAVLNGLPVPVSLAPQVVSSPPITKNLAPAAVKNNTATTPALAIKKWFSWLKNGFISKIWWLIFLVVVNVSYCSSDKVLQEIDRPEKYLLNQWLMVIFSVLSLSGLYFGYKWARKRGWWIIFSVIIGMPLGMLASIIMAFIFILSLQLLLISKEERAAIEAYDHAKKSSSTNNSAVEKLNHQ